MACLSALAHLAPIDHELALPFATNESAAHDRRLQHSVLSEARMQLGFVAIVDRPHVSRTKVVDFEPILYFRQLPLFCPPSLNRNFRRMAAPDSISVS